MKQSWTAGESGDDGWAGVLKGNGLCFYSCWEMDVGWQIDSSSSGNLEVRHAMPWPPTVAAGVVSSQGILWLVGASRLQGLCLPGDWESEENLFGWGSSGCD